MYCLNVSGFSHTSPTADKHKGFCPNTSPFCLIVNRAERPKQSKLHQTICSCQTQIALRSSAGFESLNQPTGWRRSQPINFSSLVLEVIFPLIKPSTNQISYGQLLISPTGCCGFPPYPPKTAVFHHRHDSQINNDTKQK